MEIYHFKAGDRVTVYNGQRVEGTAEIKGPAWPADTDYYVVRFDGDADGERYSRWVLPEWQDGGAGR